jgi:CHASE1-domain containing sensor protein
MHRTLDDELDTDGRGHKEHHVLKTRSIVQAKPVRPFRWAILSIEPVDRSSGTKISLPAASKASER